MEVEVQTRHGPGLARWMSESPGELPVCSFYSILSPYFVLFALEAR